MNKDKLLEFLNFSLAFTAHNHVSNIFQELSFCIEKHQMLGLLGPSGSGKSVLVKSIFNAWHEQNTQIKGEINFYQDGLPKKLFPASKGQNHFIYGKEISLIFQEPILAFNPVIKIGRQILEVLHKHFRLENAKAQEQIHNWLPKMGIENAELLNRFPHELSGGQLQRFMILMAVVTKPKLIIADEPTTSLDSISQKQILDIFKTLHVEEKIAFLIISHNPKVMDYLHAKTWQIAENTLISYENTHFLGQNIQKPKLVNTENIALTLKDISFKYDKKPILKNINLTVYANEIIGIVGKSGSGKSTLAKIILGLENADGTVLPKYKTGEVQLIFQQPGAALDPSQKAINVLKEALSVAGIRGKKNRETKAIELLHKVGLSIEAGQKYPFELSGGQKQRLCIARALCSKPHLLVCDEAVSSLDELLKDQILELLLNLNKDDALTIIFISHDIDLVAKISHRIVVMDNGNIVENGSTEELLSKPKSQALNALLAARI